MPKTKSGFTIVELLIVIVVIGILAAITIVAYNGIQERARVSSVSSALNQAAKKVAVWQVDNPSSSPNCTQFSTELGSTDTDCTFSVNSVEYQYTAGTNGTYCVTATSGPTSYKITESTKPTQGGCAGHGVGGVGAVTNMVTNPRLATSSVTWAQYGTGGSSGQIITVPDTGLPPGTTRAYRATATNAGIFGPYLDLRPLGAINVPVTASYYIRTSVAASVTIKVEQYSGNPGTRGATVNGDTVATIAGEWVRVSVQVPVNSGYAYPVITAYSNSTMPAGTTTDVTAAMTTTGTTLYTFSDGSSANWVWNGAANSSSSTGPPL